ncbi:MULTISPECIES: IclR family transcriptional regulator [Streptomyces]|uniref:IclR family transcriptional regulator n=1 Tax=Streptomyces glycanivorans TaxID=3033808 RepID=A0ABY9J8L0_9ACTN|nr:MULTISPECIES: IclR family transcriptional regulator [unclassified Streptomyces]WSQ75818.1 IclR family transcriptional regulator [Streptomyces sp. NBC_01213]TXS12734.1 IclR family transcriptional regulator [Streptomyces sp. wa22]WLQ62311.1 IclR family transcriptional regulator [Streptomyces sp. Alt3]WSQ83066.1 IclR family transcriptional regulator [Streptomyces sp. NBC_01212]WSR46400.1 IclR family transcriptional regulator [Streptomyces sp. NBC_01201]
MADPKNYIIESLDTGLRLMRLFLTHDTLSVTDAARELDVARSTAHRVLSTLESRGFATRDGSGRGYSAGPELVTLGRPAGYGPEIRARLQVVLDAAADATGETVSTAALIGDQVIITDGRESPHAVRAVLEAGRAHPAHATSAGKVLLARLTTEQVCALYPEERLPGVTGLTLVSRSALLSELAGIRALGRADSAGESVPGMNTVAVPLAGNSWRDRLALMASMPADRGGAPELDRHAAALRAAAGLLPPVC